MITTRDYIVNFYFRKNSIDISLKLLTPFYSTKNIYDIHGFLKKSIPSILYSTCYNDQNLPFSLEVLNTELGHLFEHILLEYLCIEKIKSGASSASFSGNTFWNWETDFKGNFKIKIDIYNSDLIFFDDAFKKTCEIFSSLLNNSNINENINFNFINAPMDTSGVSIG